MLRIRMHTHTSYTLFMQIRRELTVLHTGIHSHLIQYMIPKGGPKSANHTEPSSRICLPKVHSETRGKQMRLMILSNIFNNILRIQCVQIKMSPYFDVQFID